MCRILGVLTALLFFLSGCAHLGPEKSRPLDTSRWQAYRQEPLAFTSSGRISLKQEHRGAHGNYSWENYAAGLGRIELTAPFGITLGRLCRDKAGVVITDSGGKAYSGANSAQLSEALFGFEVPLDYLDLWLNGYYAENIPHQIQGNLLFQDGWKIELTRNAANKPQKLVLNKDEFTLKIVADDYADAPEVRDDLIPNCSRHAALPL